MPELPEVETMCRDLDQAICGQQIMLEKVLDERVIHPLSKANFHQAFGHTITAVTRRGKTIICHLSSGQYFVAQVKMTGYFRIWSTQNFSLEADSKVIFRSSMGSAVIYHDQRVFGWLYVVDQLADIPLFKTLGPEPFDESVDANWFVCQTGFDRKASKRRQPRSIGVKTLLLDQTFIAGIGNIYASEILYAAKINPFRPAGSINKKEATKILKHTRRILQQAIELRGTSMRNYMDSEGRKGSFMKAIKVYGRDELPCLVCRTDIQRVKQNGRSTFFCPKCQDVNDLSYPG